MELISEAKKTSKIILEISINCKREPKICKRSVKFFSFFIELSSVTKMGIFKIGQNQCVYS